MTDKPEWKEIAPEGLVNYKTHRMRVDGGYIYRYIHDDEAHVLFVPDAPEGISETLERLIELDVLIHNSDLFNRLKKLETTYASQDLICKCVDYSQSLENIHERIDCLSTSDMKSWESLERRIEKLESENGDVYIFDKHNNDLFGMLESRIKYLEEITPRYDELLKEIFNNLVALENHKNYQIDENRKVNRRLDELGSQKELE